MKKKKTTTDKIISILSSVGKELLNEEDDVSKKVKKGLSL